MKALTVVDHFRIPGSGNLVPSSIRVAGEEEEEGGGGRDVEEGQVEMEGHQLVTRRGLD